MGQTGWQFWIDRGGTFTDVIGRAPDGSLHPLKLLSDNPEHYSDAAAEGIRIVLAAAADESTTTSVDEIRMGTTVATNALLERKGARTGLLITRGFGDALQIGSQQRPEIFDLHIRLPEPLYSAVIEVDERIDADGAVLEPLAEQALHQQLLDWQNTGIESVAVCLMHAWANPVHEQRVAGLVRQAGFEQLSVSHEVSPLMNLVGRGTTTVADAYLSPVLFFYVDRFRQTLRNYGIDCPRILFMQSNGGLVSADLFRGKDAVLSGPAGGVIGMAASAAQAGLEQLIGFDMGGTSTDVSVYAGHPEVVEYTDVAGTVLRTPMIRMHTIAAGGGSQLKFTRNRFQVGPESAGANPGPMAYGHGGPLTITDANLLLGRIQADYFPATFGPNADRPLDTAAVRTAFDQLAAEVTRSSGRTFTPEQTAEGFLQIAVDNMAHAIRHVSVQRGMNPADFSLCCFGGAGGQHACQVADNLGITRILLDPMAGVLSAWGIGAAPLRSYRQAAINRVLDSEALATVANREAELATLCREQLRQQGVSGAELESQTWLEIKIEGSDTLITLPCDDIETLRRDFAAEHHTRFGFTPDNATLIIDSMRVELQDKPQTTTLAAAALGGTPESAAQVEMHQQNTWGAVPLYRREQLPAGCTLRGPAIISEATGTTVLEHDWLLEVNASGQLLLSRDNPASRDSHADTTRDPVMLEIFSNHFMQIAEEMGTVLQQTARSVNIRERLDFSCALFSPEGELIANAPHIPVHLGSMDDSVRKLLHTRREELPSGDQYLCNAPYNGGTHLPDLTVIAPVNDAQGRLLFLVASRAHHADVGGISPGSMPPLSRHIEEEGVVFDYLRLTEQGRFCEQSMREALTQAKFPARNPEQNIADCKAQIAANERGRRLLQEMIDHHGVATVHAYVGHSLDNAEESVRDVIGELCTSRPSDPGSFEYPFDNGQCIRVSVTLDPATREAEIDFSGTSPVADNNLNAPAAVCHAAVMYVFRTLVSASIPLNAGCRRPLHLKIPANSMLNPHYPAAVVGGNVETSQCVTDALYGALGVLAASQGTMNNLSFGNDSLQYYETICGGAGAGDGFAGADAVQTHMTNSRMTDAEVLETRYPVLVREFSIRRGSGGAGRYRGGNGSVRKLEFRAPLHTAILSNHRLVAPFGLAGGQAASVGENQLVRADGGIEELGSIVTVSAQPGDILVIRTPGGGGFGPPPCTE